MAPMPSNERVRTEAKNSIRKLPPSAPKCVNQPIGRADMVYRCNSQRDEGVHKLMSGGAT